MAFVDQFPTILGHVNKNRPKLMMENPIIHLISKLRFSFWSTICPAKSAINTAGMISIKPIKPSAQGSFVMEYTSHSMMMNCMDQANTRANLTNKKMLNSLIRRAA